MTESYKFKSKLATAIGAVCTIISIVGVNQLQAILPSFSEYIPIIFAFATWYISQTTENKRVEIAEQLIHEQYMNPTINEDEILTYDEPIVGEEDGC